MKGDGEEKGREGRRSRFWNLKYATKLLLLLLLLLKHKTKNISLGTHEAIQGGPKKVNHHQMIKKIVLKRIEAC